LDPLPLHVPLGRALPPPGDVRSSRPSWHRAFLLGSHFAFRLCPDVGRCYCWLSSLDALDDQPLPVTLLESPLAIARINSATDPEVGLAGDHGIVRIRHGHFEICRLGTIDVPNYARHGRSQFLPAHLLAGRRA